MNKKQTGFMAADLEKKNEAPTPKFLHFWKVLPAATF